MNLQTISDVSRTRFSQSKLLVELNNFVHSKIHKTEKNNLPFSKYKLLKDFIKLTLKICDKL